jgi:hypothetical protein
MTDKEAKGQGGGDAGFDTTAELWDRVTDDVADNGYPCFDTVRQLLEDSCRHPANPDKPGGDAPDQG